MSAIYLVRHGITPANKENRFAGRTSEELHVEGIKQIRQVGERLRNTNIKAICCGPAKRTIQSAEILGSLLNCPFSSLPELHEINIPHWEGLTKDKIRQRYGAQYPTWLSTPQTFNLPGCETLEQVQKRAVVSVTRLLAEHIPGDHLLVSHLIVLRCLVLYFQRLGIKDFRSVKIDNGEIIRLSEMGTGRISVSFL
jgi:broad specificity phosphatase PhoE